MLDDAVYREFEEVVGPDNISREPAILDGYAYQTVFNPTPSLWLNRPAAVALPGSTEEVQGIVKVCNRYHVRFKAHSTGWGVFNAPGYEDMIILDLRRMNRILQIDENNMFALIEPYITCNQLQAEAMKKGLNCHIIGAGPNTSVLASCTSVGGVGWTGISMGYNCRNVLGVEWVLPTGEVVRLGSPGSGDGWFSGDGPGPSLRGVMRGLFGAMGGLGVFTKVAVKLFNWPGPKRIDARGLMFDIKAEVPENIKLYILLFPDMQRFLDATYDLGDAEIGWIHSRNPAGMLFTFLFPGLMRETAGRPAMRAAMESIKHMVSFGIAATSPGELAYQEKVLREVIARNDGVMIDMGKLPQFESFMLFGLMRSTLSAFVFRAGGNFASSLVGEETTDSGAPQVELGVRIKQEYIDKGALIDDMGDTVWGSIYENNLFAHYESLMSFDSRDPRQQEWIKVDEELVDELIDRKWGIGIGLSGAGTVVHKKFGPHMCNYDKWQRRIKKALDPEGLSDPIGYTEPGD